MLGEYDGSKVNQCEALWNIARELSRKNDLQEIETLCRTAKALRSAGMGSSIGSCYKKPIHCCQQRMRKLDNFYDYRT